MNLIPRWCKILFGGNQWRKKFLAFEEEEKKNKSCCQKLGDEIQVMLQGEIAKFRLLKTFGAFPYPDPGGHHYNIRVARLDSYGRAIDGKDVLRVGINNQPRTFCVTEFLEAGKRDTHCQSEPELKLVSGSALVSILSNNVLQSLKVR